MFYYVIVLLIAFIFYLLFPGIGAVRTRNSWRLFRQALVDSSFFPILDYASLRGLNEGIFRYFRFFGSLEAIQGDDLIWIRGNNILASVEMKEVNLFVLELKEEEVQDGDNPFGDKEAGKLTSLSWEHIFSLPEGTKLFIAGPLFKEQGKAIFRGEPEYKLTMIIYEGETELLLQRAIWGGRQNNEYWNRLTPGSLGVGFFSLLVLANFFLSQSYGRPLSLIALTLSLLPFSVLLPPGLFFFFSYLNQWKLGRRLRAERDLLRLPLRYFFEDPKAGGEARLPDGNVYFCKSIKWGDTMTSGLSKSIRIWPSLLKKDDLTDRGGYCFGILPTFDASSTQKRDPFAENIIIPDNPSELAHKSEKKALRHEIKSLFLVIAGLLINTYIMLVVLQRLLY
ncbi:hypothetical protein [Spirochaeta cellobiosiphila]|uniref:hypothetical protein n=1 Tax=Spirochaeta cellobiosiphila TaxID=504483 RepID=UPI000400A805|nr:hypothetical protein [Spirochaeta cellobiosiphila]